MLVALSPIAFATEASVVACTPCVLIRTEAALMMESRFLSNLSVALLFVAIGTPTACNTYSSHASDFHVRQILSEQAVQVLFKNLAVRIARQNILHKHDASRHFELGQTRRDP